MFIIVGFFVFCLFVCFFSQKNLIFYKSKKRGFCKKKSWLIEFSYNAFTIYSKLLTILFKRFLAFFSRS